jgi:uncharacterized protein YjbJ (UPF0337 family)
MTEEQTRGQWDQAKGEVKEGVGKMTGDRSTEMSGKWDQTKGKVEEGIGDMKKDIEHDADR